MVIDDTMIQAFLNDEDIEACPFFPCLKHYHTPDRKRKDVVKALLSQLKTMINEFPVFNKTLWDTLFTAQHAQLAHCVIHPVVGFNQHHIEKIEDTIYIHLDLIHIANYTPIVSQMVYIMQNYLTKELASLCIHHDFPFQPTGYIHILDYFTFCHGLSNFIAWNKDALDYRFYTEKYEPYKEKAFGSLAQALEVENKALQHRVLVSATSGDLWNQFPSAAGMFYFDDIYRACGLNGIQAIYKKGPDGLIQSIFQG